VPKLPPGRSSGLFEVRALRGKRNTVALLHTEPLGSEFVGEIPGNRRVISGSFPASDSRKWFIVSQGYGNVATNARIHAGCYLGFFLDVAVQQMNNGMCIGTRGREELVHSPANKGNTNKHQSLPKKSSTNQK
jgi:hypothetical protein